MGFHNAARPAANSHAQRRVIACEKLRDERLAPEGESSPGNGGRLTPEGGILRHHQPVPGIVHHIYFACPRQMFFSKNCCITYYNRFLLLTLRLLVRTPTTAFPDSLLLLNTYQQRRKTHTNNGVPG